MKPKGHFSEPKGRIFDRASNELRDVIVIGKDQNGDVQLWSTGDQQSTASLFDTARSAVLEPAE
jgi:hypothetical protein